MKLFGNFLVERNEISSADLVDALIVQLKGLPTVAEIVHKEKLISNDDQMKVLTYQAKYRCEYIAACRHFGLWGDRIESSVMNELRSCRKPIGQILVEHSKITAEKLTGLLDEFISEVPREENARRHNVSETQMKINGESSPSTEREVILKDFAPIFSRLASSDPVLKEFFEIFDSGFMLKVKALLEGLEVDDGQAQSKLAALQSDIVTAAASSRFVRLPLLSRLFESIEALMSNTRIELLDANRRADLKFAFDIAWQIRKQVSQDESEEAYWSNSQTRILFSTAVRRLEDAASKVVEPRSAA
jgi:hypothetical protein